MIRALFIGTRAGGKPSLQPLRGAKSSSSSSGASCEDSAGASLRLSYPAPDIGPVLEEGFVALVADRDDPEEGLRALLGADD